jgi:Metal-dependent amidase/aminoacylase/carboxypeptidase
MQLTVRTYKDEVRERVLAAIDRIAKGCAMAAGVPNDKMPEVKVRRDEFTPATYNNPDLTKRLVGVWKNSLGTENVEMVDPTMGGEDFSEFSLPDHSDPCSRRPHRCCRARQGRRIQEARCNAPPESAFE